MTNGAGRFKERRGGYSTFVPSPLPPDIEMDTDLARMLSEATLELGRLDGLAEVLPNPDLFVMMYVRKEAVLSSQIEGTQASLLDVLEFEARALDPKAPEDVGEVVNYVGAMELGLERIRSEEVSVDLMRDMHRALLTGTRGGEREPGELRRVQNWTGPEGAGIDEAVFVPPAPEDMGVALGELETYLASDDGAPTLLRAGLAHAQFESIHPFLDGNGRIGRLLVTLMLVRSGHLSRPLLYLSYHLKRHRAEYYDRLQAVRTAGAWEDWLRFFLEAVREASIEAIGTSRRIIDLRGELVAEVTGKFGDRGAAALRLLDELFNRPVVTVNSVASITGLSYPGANRLVARFEGMGILVEVTGQSRNRVYEFERYMDILGDGPEGIDVTA